MEKISNTALWDLCRKYGGEARRWTRRFVALLPEVERRRLYKRHGFYSIYEFAAKVGGVTARVVDEILALDKRLRDKPLLKAQVAEIGWSKVSVIAPITTKENQAEMVKIAKSLPQIALRAYVSQIRPVDECEERCKPTVNCKLQSVTFKLDSETQFMLKQYQQKLEKEHHEPIPLGKVLKILLKKVQEPIREPRMPKKETKTICAYKKYEVNNGGKCSFPGCNKPHEVFHHPNRYALDPSHDNIVPLCEEHHKLMHAGLVENEKSPPDEWKLRDHMELNSIDKKYQQHFQKAFEWP